MIAIDMEIPESCEKCHIKTVMREMRPRIISCNIPPYSRSEGTQCIERHPDCPLRELEAAGTIKIKYKGGTTSTLTKYVIREANNE